MGKSFLLLFFKKEALSSPKSKQVKRFFFEKKKQKTFIHLSQEFGWGTWIRTKAARVRAGSSTAKLSPKQGRATGNPGARRR